MNQPLSKPLHDAVAARLTRLREQMRAQGVDAYLVPVSDPYFNEEIPLQWQRFQYLTGFNPSSGLAVITQDKAALVFDGIYHAQGADHLAKQGIDDLFELLPVQVSGHYTQQARDWLKQHIPQGGTIGYDAMLHTKDELAEIRDDQTSPPLTLQPIESNLVDAAIGELDPERLAQLVPTRIELLPERFTGEGAQSKIARTLEAIEATGHTPDVTLLSPPSSLCWLLNVRGHDAVYAPLPFMRGWIDRAGQVTLFTDAQRLDANARAYLDAVQPPVRILPESAMRSELQQLAAADKHIMIHAGSMPEWFERTIIDARQKAGLSPEGGLIEEANPMRPLLGVKNEQEVAAMRQAHLQDAIALVNFLSWLDAQKATGTHALSEKSIAEKLHACRAERPGFKSESFATIAAAGPHSAFLHYADYSDALLQPTDQHLLLDSGAQYYDPQSGLNGTPTLCGTTDITRVIPLQPVIDPALKKAYSLSLKAMITLARHRFDDTTTAQDLDRLARDVITSDPEYSARERELYPDEEVMYGYQASTGHGVGFYSDLHEHIPHVSVPGNMSKRTLNERSIFSNEPGYYDAEKGIGMRVENLHVVQKAADGLYELDNLTLVLIDTKMVDFSYLSREDVQWLNDYHAKVREALLPHLEHAQQEWLVQATQPVGKWQALAGAQPAATGQGRS